MHKGLKIAFFGSSLVSSYQNPPAHYFRGIVRALHELGHEVTFYEPNLVDRLRHRDIANPIWTRLVIYPARTERDLYPLYTDAHEADIIIKANRTGAFDEILDESLLSLRTLNNIVMYWDMTPSTTLFALQMNSESPLRKLIPRYDLVLVSGGGESVVKTYLQLGAKQCEIILNALDPLLYFPTHTDERFRSEFALNENRYADQEPRLDEFFFKPAAQLVDAEILIGGSGWQDHAHSKNVRYAGPIHPRDINAFNSTPKCLLLPSASSEIRLSLLPASKAIEAAGAGACFITHEPEKISMFLDPEREFLTAGCSEEVVHHIKAFSPSEAKKIGTIAMQHLLAEHTYFHRAAQLERLIGASRIVRETVFY
jgi:spore maturation protein CgeB